jgi:hypothetical protein
MRPRLVPVVSSTPARDSSREGPRRALVPPQERAQDPLVRGATPASSSQAPACAQSSLSPRGSNAAQKSSSRSSPCVRPRCRADLAIGNIRERIHLHPAAFVLPCGESLLLRPFMVSASISSLSLDAVGSARVRSGGCYVERENVTDRANVNQWRGMSEDFVGSHSRLNNTWELGEGAVAFKATTSFLSFSTTRGWCSAASSE